MSYQFSPLSFSSPPQYLDNMSPPRQETNTHGRTPTSGGPKPKRRRLEHELEVDLNIRPGDIPSTDSQLWSFVPSFESQNQQFSSIPGQDLMDLNPPSSFWSWDEVEAFDYLTSDPGFRRDFYGMQTYNNQTLANSPPSQNAGIFAPREYNYQQLPTYAEMSPVLTQPIGEVAVDQGKSIEATMPILGEPSRPSFSRFPIAQVYCRPSPPVPRQDEGQRMQVNTPEMNRGNRVPPHTRTPVRPNTINRSGPNKPSILLTLSRATESSIAEIPEHKRECPACQLEFEPDNYVASISCCNTCMHATCLSAWVNSQTYAKAKVCMKCRKPVDARRPLNTVVPPVTDKIWDEGVDFNAPESLKGDSKIELDVGGRPERVAGFSRVRRPPHYSYNRRRRMINDDELPVEVRTVVQRMRNEDQKVIDSMKVDCQQVYNEWSLAYEAEAQAAQVVMEAREALKQNQIRPCELDILIDRCRDARVIQERKHEAFKQKVQGARTSEEGSNISIELDYGTDAQWGDEQVSKYGSEYFSSSTPETAINSVVEHYQIETYPEKVGKH